MPKDSAGMVRGLDVLQAFGATHLKMRIPHSFASGATLVRLARARGMTVSGHCANPLSLVVAGISAQEHLDGQCSRRSPWASEDRARLYGAMGVVGVPTIYLTRAYGDASRDTSSAHAPDIEPFLTPKLRLSRLRATPAPTNGTTQGSDAARGTQWFHHAGLPLAVGVDAPDLPGAEHDELAEMVTAGLTPAEALAAATTGTSRLLGLDADVGRIAEGQVADIVLLDADPLADIRNTRRIWRVIQSGRVVDRDALRRWAAEGR
jgi:hypothetical protein